MLYLGNPINSLFVAPAVTPVKNVLQKLTNNPGIRLFQYDPRDYKLVVSWRDFRIDPIVIHTYLCGFISLVEYFQQSYRELYFVLKSQDVFLLFVLGMQHFLSRAL